MSSKFLGCFALACLIFNAACNVRLREAESPEPLIQLDSVQQGCLEGAFQKLHMFFEGKTSAQEMDQLWECAAKSLRLFTERTRGAQKGQYSPIELRNFYQRYFAKDAHISNEFIEQAMKLKRGVLGGSEETLTAQELQSIRTLIETLRIQTWKLAPFMPLEADLAAEAFNTTQVDQMARTIVEVSEALGNTLELSSKDYYFDEFEQFLKQLAMTYPGSGPKRVLEQMRFFQYAKSVLIAPPLSRISADQWKQVIRTGAQWYALFVQFVHFNKKYDTWTSGDGRARLIELAEKGEQLLTRSLTYQPNGQVSFDDLKNWILSYLPGKELVPITLGANTFMVNKSTLTGLVEPIMTRYLGGTDRDSSGRLASGVTLGVIRRTSESLHRWNATQVALESALLRNEQEPSIIELMPGFGMGGPIRFLKEDPRLHFGELQPEARDQFYALTRLNWMRELFRPLIQGYSSDIQRAKLESGLNLNEFQCFTDDIRDIGIELNIVDSRKWDIHFKRFREANLFTYAANGDNYIDLIEGTELLAFLFSADAAASQVHEDIAYQCPIESEVIFGKPKILAPCYRRAFFNHFSDNFEGQVPKMVQFYEGLSKSEKRGFRNHYEVASRTWGYSDRPIDISDTQGFALIPQYIELMFSRFDANRSGTIDYEEGKKAYPLFKNTMNNLVQTLTGDSLSAGKTEALFHYLLAWGNPPDAGDDGKTSIKGKLKFGMWLLSKKQWSYNADRGRLMEILAEISASSGDGTGKGELKKVGPDATDRRQCRDWINLGQN